MPRIDPLLTALVSNRADSVRLADGDIAHIIKGGTQHPLTRQPLGDGQLLLLLKEMAPPEFASRLGGLEPVEFTYTNSAGHFVARVSQEGGKLGAMVTAATAPAVADAPVAAAAEPPVVSPTPVASAAHVAPAAPVAEAAPTSSAAAPQVNVQAPRVIDSAAKAEIESLLRVL